MQRSFKFANASSCMKPMGGLGQIKERRFTLIKALDTSSTVALYQVHRPDLVVRRLIFLLICRHNCQKCLGEAHAEIVK